MGAHQRFLLAAQLAQYDTLSQSIDRVWHSSHGTHVR
jgi:hypothetical protein